MFCFVPLKTASHVTIPKTSWMQTSKIKRKVPEGSNIGEQIWNTLREDMVQLEDATKMNTEACTCLIHVILARVCNYQVDMHGEVHIM